MRPTIATGGLPPRETGAAALNGSQGGRSALFALRCPTAACRFRATSPKAAVALAV